MKRTKLERETIIIFNEEETTAEVSSYNAHLIKVLLQAAEDYPDECICTLHGEESSDFVIPKKWVSHKVKPPRKRKLTEEERKAISARLHKNCA